MKILHAAALTAALLLTAREASARPPIGIGPRVSLNLDGTDLGIGAEARIGLLQLSPMMRLDLRGSFDWYFPGSDVTFFVLAADALLAFPLASVPMVEPYALAGLGIAHTSVDVGGFEGSATDVGLHLGGGAKFLPTGAIQPFAELRIWVGDGSFVAITGGVLFVL
jgi:hypothetical protein